jgi:hypothetical protein
MDTALVDGGLRGSAGSCAIAIGADNNTKASVSTAIHILFIYLDSPFNLTVVCPGSLMTFHIVTTSV